MGRVKRRTTKEKLNEVYNHLVQYYGVRTKQDMANRIKRGKSAFYSAINGSEKYMTEGLVDIICNAFPNVFNKDYLLCCGGDLLTEEEAVRCERIKNAYLGMGDAPDCQPMPADDPSIISTLKDVIKTTAADHARHIATLESKITDRDAIIDDRNKTIADLEATIVKRDLEIVNLQHQIAALQHEIENLKTTHEFSGYLPPQGVAEHKQK